MYRKQDNKNYKNRRKKGKDNQYLPLFIMLSGNITL